MSAIENWAREASSVPGYFDTSRRQSAIASSHFSSSTNLRFISSRMSGLRASSGYFARNSANSLLARVVVLGLELLGGHQVLGVDDLPLHVAPRLVGRMLRQVLAPRGQRLGELLLQLIAAAQQVAGVGNLLAVLVAVVGQEPLEALTASSCRPRCMKLKAISRWAWLASLCAGNRSMNASQRGHAEVQFLVVAAAAGICHVRARLNCASAIRSDCESSYLASRSCHVRRACLQVALGQAALAQAEAGLDRPAGCRRGP